jgi:hypothetical protein
LQFGLRVSVLQNDDALLALLIFCGAKGATKVKMATLFDQIIERAAWLLDHLAACGHEVTLACRPTR